MPFDAPETVRWPIRLIVLVDPSKVFKTQIYGNNILYSIFLSSLSLSLRGRDFEYTGTRFPDCFFIHETVACLMIFFVTYLYASNGTDQMVPEQYRIPHRLESSLRSSFRYRSTEIPCVRTTFIYIIYIVNIYTILVYIVSIRKNVHSKCVNNLRDRYIFIFIF